MDSNSSDSVEPLEILISSQVSNAIEEILNSISSSYIFLHTIRGLFIEYYRGLNPKIHFSEQKIANAWLLTIERNLSNSPTHLPLRKILLEWLDIMVLSHQLVSPFNKFPISSISLEILEKIGSENTTKKILTEIDLIQSEKLHKRELNDSQLVLTGNIDDDNDDCNNKTFDDIAMEPDWLQGARQLKREVKQLLKECYYATQ